MNNEKHTDNILYTCHDQFLVESCYTKKWADHDEPLWQTSADITLAQERDTRLPGYENGCFIFKSNTLGVDEIHLWNIR